MAKYDKGDTIPVQGPIPGEDDPMLAITMAEQNNLGPNDTIVNLFTQSEKQNLVKMIKDGEFSQLEAAVLHVLMSEAITLEDVGAMIGAVSRRTKGKPASKPAAIKEINRILGIVAKRSKAKFGKEIDIAKTAKEMKQYKKEMERVRKWREKKAREAKAYANKVEREFYKTLSELRKVQKAHGLPTSKYVPMDQWNPLGPDVPYIRTFAPKDQDISKIKRFGGTPDER